MSIATCNVCKAFSVPWDEIGVELMKAHFHEKHQEIGIKTTPAPLPRMTEEEEGAEFYGGTTP